MSEYNNNNKSIEFEWFLFTDFTLAIDELYDSYATNFFLVSSDSLDFSNFTIWMGLWLGGVVLRAAVYVSIQRMLFEIMRLISRNRLCNTINKPAQIRTRWTTTTA